MGGRGSGRRQNPWSRKRLVNDGLTMDIATFDMDKFIIGQTCEMFWKNGKKKIATMGFRIEKADDKTILNLLFTHSTPHGAINVHEKIPLLSTQLHFGGIRWWFSCPCCQRRVRTLHLPQREHRLECRQCHRLTYKSVREHDKRVDELVRNPKEAMRIWDTYNENPSVLDLHPKFHLASRALMKLESTQSNIST